MEGLRDCGTWIEVFVGGTGARSGLISEADAVSPLSEPAEKEILICEGCCPVLAEQTEGSSGLGSNEENY